MLRNKIKNLLNDLKVKTFVKNQAGMTLVEIMIVVAILGGLMAILGQTVSSQFKKSQVKSAKIQIRELTKALELYATDCGSFPDDGKGLDALLEDPGDCDGWGPEPYAKESQIKDPWKNDFEYQRDGSNFVIISYGADKEEGGDTYDKDISSADM